MSDAGCSRVRCDNAAQIGHLEDILINIISRLPLKDAVACKIVKKHWLSMISEPKFAKLQLSHPKKTPTILSVLIPKDRMLLLICL